MTQDVDPKDGDAGLWRQARAGWAAAQAAQEPPDEVSLAAYLDGALEPTAEARVEAWLARSPEALDLVLAARQAMAEPSGPAPEAVVRRAEALVPGRPARPASSWLDWLFEPFAPLARPAAWAGVAAAVLITAVSGFELGRTGIQHMAALDAAVAGDVRLVLGHSAEDLL